MVSAIDSAVSGLAAAGKILEISAQNIANQSSTKTQVNGKTINAPYVPQKVDTVTLSDGAVKAQVSNVNPATVTVPSNNPQSNGTQQVPNVDQAQELVNQQIAANTYKANLKTIKVQENLDKSLLDITS